MGQDRGKLLRSSSHIRGLSRIPPSDVIERNLGPRLADDAPVTRVGRSGRVGWVPRADGPPTRPGLRLPDPPAAKTEPTKAGFGNRSASGVQVRRAEVLSNPKHGWATVEPHTLVAPVGPAQPAATEGLVRGQRVRAELGGQPAVGVLAGYDFRGRPVVQTDERRICKWPQIAPEGPILAQKPPASVMPAAALIRPPEKLLAALNAAFDTQVCGAHTAREYIEAMHAGGFTVYLTGGAIRDAIRVFATNPEADVAAILDTLKDIDLVTTAPPPAVRAIAQKIAPEYKNGAVWSPMQVDQFGSVLIGGPKAGLPNPEGLDVTSMRSDGAFTEPVRHRDTGETVHPYTFDHDLVADTGTRDFACNALYYDPLNQVLVDPTGRGIEDAQKNRLRVARSESLEKDDNIALRFWKFRIRGFDADPETRGLIRHQAKTVLWKTPRWKVVSNLVRTSPKTAKSRADVELHFQKLAQVMAEDGCADLFKRRLLPLFDQVVDKIERRAARGLK